LRLVAFTASHPEPGRVRQRLIALGEELTVEPGEVPALVATFDAPRGRVVLGG
jgi:hypothetical protein